MTEKGGKGLKVPFGRKADRLVAPTQALDAGLDCQCTCPGCGAKLLLRQGSRRRHFAHYNAPGSDGCVESAIHAAAKQVLIDHGGLVVPEVAFEVSATTSDGVLLRESEVLSAQRRIRFDHTIAEVTIDDIRPDVVGYRGERQLLVEMYFRHRVDPGKRDKLKRLGLPALEIDLSNLDQLDDFEAVKERVLENVVYKEWLVYPRVDEHIAYLQHKLQCRVDAANEAHQAELERRRQERERVAQLEKARLAAKADIDAAFALWTPDEQTAWLRERLGLSNEVPAFLGRPLVPRSALMVPPFLFQASIFERFIYHSENGARLTADGIYPCLRRRFELRPHDIQTHRLAINIYLEYLFQARFLSRAAENEIKGPYFVRHNAVSMPPWTPEETRYDGVPFLSSRARGTGKLRVWCSIWPRWRTVLAEADEHLVGSPYRDALLEGLDGLSALTPPATPHHWAAPLVDRGVPLEDCLALLASVGLLAD